MRVKKVLVALQLGVTLGSFKMGFDGDGMGWDRMAILVHVVILIPSLLSLVQP